MSTGTFSEKSSSLGRSKNGGSIARFGYNPDSRSRSDVPEEEASVPFGRHRVS